jgi:hypothetical protein
MATIMKSKVFSIAEMTDGTTAATWYDTLSITTLSGISTTMVGTGAVLVTVLGA